MRQLMGFLLSGRFAFSMGFIQSKMYKNQRSPMTISAPPTVRQLMDRVFVKLPPEMPVAKAVSILLKKKLTGAPVVDENGRLIGILSEKDCLKTLMIDAYDQMPLGIVSEYMSTELFSVHPDIEIFQLAELFLSRVYRRFPVVEDGQLVGQITRRDLLRAIAEYWA